MVEQFSLMGFDDGPKPTDSVFFATFPPGDSASRIAELARHLRSGKGLKGTPRPTDHFHVSLHDLGTHTGLPKGLVAAAIEAAATVEVPPFDVTFDRVVSFRGGKNGRPLVLQGGSLAALSAFHRSLGLALATTLHGYRPQRPSPHITLLYDEQGGAELSVEPISWTVREFVLVHSFVGQTRYEALAQWPLLG
jgi:RNA 2',3'-cyclic 3'-phosphodiesterase